MKELLITDIQRIELMEELRYGRKSRAVPHGQEFKHYKNMCAITSRRRYIPQSGDPTDSNSIWNEALIGLDE